MMSAAPEIANDTAGAIAVLWVELRRALDHRQRIELVQLGVQQRKAWPERNEAPGLAQLVPQRRQQRDER